MSTIVVQFSTPVTHIAITPGKRLARLNVKGSASRPPPMMLLITVTTVALVLALLLAMLPAEEVHHTKGRGERKRAKGFDKLLNSHTNAHGADRQLAVSTEPHFTRKH